MARTDGNGTSTSWEAIEISFLSDHRVQIIRNGRDSATCNYSELGFEDKRNGKPNQAWGTLLALARERGTIRDGSSAGKHWPQVEKRMQEIRKTLRRHFSLEADPVPFIPGTGYQALFKITCALAFDS